MPITWQQLLSHLGERESLSEEELTFLRGTLSRPTPVEAEPHSNGSLHADESQPLIIGDGIVVDRVEDENRLLRFVGRRAADDRPPEFDIRLALTNDQTASADLDAIAEQFRKSIHRNLRPVQHVYSQGRLVWIGTDRDGSETLASVIGESGPLPVEAAAECGQQILAGLRYAKRQGLQLAELTAEAVSLTEDGVAVIDHWLPASLMFRVSGPPASNGHAEKAHDDQHLLRSLAQVLELLIGDEDAEAEELRPKCQTIIARCRQADDGGYASLEACEQDLDALLNDRPLADPPPAVTTPASETESTGSPPASETSGGGTLIVILIVVALVVTGYFLLR